MRQYYYIWLGTLSVVTTLWTRAFYVSPPNHFEG